MKEKVAVSACLLGVNSKYDGGCNLRKDILNELKDKIVYVICPEVFSKMPIPRDPSEIKGDRVVNINGVDVTLYFINGANATLSFLRDKGIKKIYLKDGSPSCGVSYTYDGTFTHTKEIKMGYTAKLLKEKGYELIAVK